MEGGCCLIGWGWKEQNYICVCWRGDLTGGENLRQAVWKERDRKTQWKEGQRDIKTQWKEGWRDIKTQWKEGWRYIKTQEDENSTLHLYPSAFHYGHFHFTTPLLPLQSLYMAQERERTREGGE